MTHADYLERIIEAVKDCDDLDLLDLILCLLAESSQ